MYCKYILQHSPLGRAQCRVGLEHGSRHPRRKSVTITKIFAFSRRKKKLFLLELCYSVYRCCSLNSRDVFFALVGPADGARQTARAADGGGGDGGGIGKVVGGRGSRPHSVARYGRGGGLPFPDFLKRFLLHVSCVAIGILFLPNAGAEENVKAVVPSVTPIGSEASSVAVGPRG